MLIFELPLPVRKDPRPGDLDLASRGLVDRKRPFGDAVPVVLADDPRALGLIKSLCGAARAHRAQLIRKRVDVAGLEISCAADRDLTMRRDVAHDDLAAV